MPRYLPLICLISFIAALPVFAQELPKGGGLDPQRVAEARYGAVAQPVAPAAGDKRPPREEAARESPPPSAKRPTQAPVSARKSGETPAPAAAAAPMRPTGRRGYRRRAG